MMMTENKLFYQALDYGVGMVLYTKFTNINNLTEIFIEK